LDAEDTIREYRKNISDLEDQVNNYQYKNEKNLQKISKLKGFLS
jgi:hypothetical protein